MLQQAMKVDCGIGRIGGEGRAVEEDGTKISNGGGDGVLFLTGGAGQPGVRPRIGVEFEDLCDVIVSDR